VLNSGDRSTPPEKETNVSNQHLVRLLAGSVLLALAGVGIASAQTTSSSASTTTFKSSTVAQATAPPKKQDPPLITLHLTPQWTWMLGTSDLPRPNFVCSSPKTKLTGGTCGQAGAYAYANGQTRIGYGANIYLTPKVTLNYVHSYINQTLGRVTTGTGPATAYEYQVFNDDRVDDGSLAFPIGSIPVAFGYHQRIRMCCGNTPGIGNGNVENWWYAQLSPRFGPKSKYFGGLVGITTNAAYIPHPVCGDGAQSCSLANAIKTGQDGGNKWKWTGTFNLTYPVGGKDSPFALYGTYLNDWDYYWNSPIFYLYNRIDYGFIYHYQKYATLTVADSNLYQHRSVGYPYDFPNTINRDKLTVVMDFALPTSF
jgi:hypothetical protein